MQRPSEARSEDSDVFQARDLAFGLESRLTAAAEARETFGMPRVGGDLRRRQVEAVVELPVLYVDQHVSSPSWQPARQWPWWCGWHGGGVLYHNLIRDPALIGVVMSPLFPQIIVIDKPDGLNMIPGLSGGPEVLPAPVGDDESDMELLREEEGDEEGEREGEGGDSKDAGGPTKKRKRPTMQDNWSAMLKDWATIQLSDEQQHLQPYLERLGSLSAVPRKRPKFTSFVGRALKLTDQGTAEELFDLLMAELYDRQGPPPDSVLTRLLRFFKEARTVHRLDQETSGVCVVALTVQAARELSLQFHDRAIDKSYVAVVTGGPIAAAEGEVGSHRVLYVCVWSLTTTSPSSSSRMVITIPSC
jgi:hypothetical protein